MKTSKSMKPKMIFHLLPNAHLDPVWLWDWREGMNEGIITVRTILDLMDEFPELTFIRGESSIYQHIEENDPATFDRIGRMVKTGRWDIVGGTYNQPDTNLAATETLCRQYEVGQAYFQSRFGITPRIAWQADSFGHTPGLPNIMRAFGMEGFMFTRPQRGDFPMDDPAFWWECDHADRILAYRQHYVAYCSEHHNLHAILDTTLKDATPLPLQNVAVLMGLGNHGGGPSRRHIEDARTWAARHPEVELRFSTFHRFFDALKKEVSAGRYRIPSVKGDLGFCLRGCYSSVAKLKAAYRRAESLLVNAEITQSLVRTQVGFPVKPLAEAWEGILFSSFHDILPGTSIERAMDDQMNWLGKSHHEAERVRFHALNRLATQVDSRVPAAPAGLPTEVPLLVWNPLPRPYKAWVELEACLDYRPDFKVRAEVGTLPLRVTGPQGEKPIFQEIPTEHTAMRDGAWRKRVLFQTELPALGWKVFRMGRGAEGERPPTRRDNANACRAGEGATPFIQNKNWKVQLTKAGLIKIFHKDEPLFGKAGAMKVEISEDIWGSWGGVPKGWEARAVEKVLESWTVARHSVLQKGPEQAVLYTRWQGKNSWLDLTFVLRADGEGVRVTGRALWNERSARLKLAFPSTGPLSMQVPASEIARPQPGNLASGKWFRRGTKAAGLGFISDVLGDVDATADRVHVTIARASRYADDVPTDAEEVPWLPAVDCGELKFQFGLTTADANLNHLAEQMIHAPHTLTLPPHPGLLGATGSLAELQPRHVALLSARALENNRLQVRIQNQSRVSSEASLILAGKKIALGTIQPFEIKTLTVKAPAVQEKARAKGR